MVGLVNHQQVEGIRPAIEATDERLNARDLHGPVWVFRFARGNEPELHAQGLEAVGSLRNQLLTVDEDRDPVSLLDCVLMRRSRR